MRGEGGQFQDFVSEPIASPVLASRDHDRTASLGLEGRLVRHRFRTHCSVLR